METFQFQEAFVRDKIGFVEVARKDDDQETSDLAVAAVEALLAKTPLALDTVECLAVVTQNPDGHGLPHTSAIVHGKLGLPKSCFAFDIALGCSGYVAGLAIFKGFMETTGARTGLLVTADPYSKVVDPEDRNTSLIFGDGATATLLADDPVWSIGAFDMGTEGARHGALQVGETGKLFMNGRAVFDFSALAVPQSVRTCLEKNACALEDVDVFLLHQGSKYIVDTVARRLGVTNAPFGAAGYGNTVSSSLPMLLEALSPGEARTVLMSGFGVGLGWATTVLRSCVE